MEGVGCLCQLCAHLYAEMGVERARRDDERGNMREGVLRTWLREGSELDAGSARRACLWEIRPNPEARPRDLACYATFASDCFMHAAAACRLV